ncbi:pilus assembly protein TadB [Paenibacillus darwinianus]|uniref:Pilus assembly protein TadB n=2 Tax=Paenibacillus darwinianus TaxID=1380763 RepID=A0A9W5S1G7_9BACL|nr:pilus assembly protein TadB [Paenibacillus darwinianus]EXX89965.1 pilus assembly protein TadB [Paenibacillus darwinianus]EXX90225.1 pilus assembly protein TadB [Paenibacillus darwinianus]
MRRLSRLQYGMALAAGGIAGYAAGYLFYSSVWIALLFSPLGLMTPRWLRKELAVMRKRRMALQFKEALQCIASSLSAGRSVENAIITVPDELRTVFPDPRTEIRVEFERIRSGIRTGDNLEACLRAFSDRVGLEEIARFCDVLAIAKRSGGDMVAIVRRSAGAIGEKLEVEREISVMVAQKRFEARIMMAVPFVFMAVLSWAAPDYLAPLRQGMGYAVVTVALIMLVGCIYLIHRWMSFEV